MQQLRQRCIIIIVIITYAARVVHKPASLHLIALAVSDGEKSCHETICTATTTHAALTPVQSSRGD